MKKIIVIGCPGSGKSTFSINLHKITLLPIYHLDMMYWNPDKTIVEKSVFIERLTNTIHKSKWIIDGNYESTMEIRMIECDTVFFLDYPVEMCLSGVEKRKGKTRVDMPWIDEDTDDEFIEFIKNYNLQSRPKAMDLLEKYSDKKIVIFKNRNEAEEYLEMLEGGHLV